MLDIFPYESLGFPISIHGFSSSAGHRDSVQRNLLGSNIDKRSSKFTLL